MNGECLRKSRRRSGEEIRGEIKSTIVLISVCHLRGATSSSRAHEVRCRYFCTARIKRLRFLRNLSDQPNHNSSIPRIHISAKCAACVPRLDQTNWRNLQSRLQILLLPLKGNVVSRQPLSDGRRASGNVSQAAFGKSSSAASGCRLARRRANLDGARFFQTLRRACK